MTQRTDIKLQVLFFFFRISTDKKKSMLILMHGCDFQASENVKSKNNNVFCHKGHQFATKY